MVSNAGGENPVEALILKHGKEAKTVFVFPSDIAASLWREEALNVLGIGTIESRRFIAWDRFKAEAIRSAVGNRQPVTAPVRGLYARSLARRNAQAEPPLFRSLIPETYAAEGGSFAPWLGRLLPQLVLWEEKRFKARDMPLFPVPEDSEDSDLEFLKADYAAFLDRHGLYEPSWERPPLRKTGYFYIILFIEAIEDWTEFAPALGKADFIQPVSCLDLPEFGGKAAKACLYDNTRDEFKACALEIESLIARGAPADRIAISVPDLETVSPYLTRELALRGIPFEYRSGQPLGGRSAGRLFRLIDSCAGEDFSFAAVKALMLDRLIPWANPELAERLIAFGIANRCVTSWTDSGRRMDPWEEAFRSPARFTEPDEGLRAWYRELRRALVSLTKAESFSEIRNRWFAFRNRFFDMSLLDPADDAVLARCVEELTNLSALETEYAELLTGGTWQFFLETLDSTMYVSQRPASGVNLFPWRVAAGTPFPWHFALDASQDRATVLYRQLTFLREDKREALRSQEVDATASFFAVYAACPRRSNVSGVEGFMRFSVSTRSFKGYSTPHNGLTAIPVKPFSQSAESCGRVDGSTVSAADGSGASGLPGAGMRSAIIGQANGPYPLRDPFRDELGFAARSAEPDRLYPVQIEGEAAYYGRERKQSERRFTYLRRAYENGTPGLAEKIEARQYDDGAVRVSQTDLSVHSVCPARWFLGKILEIEPPESDAELMNDRRLGIVYHEVFKRVYGRIRETDGAFRSSRLDTYREWAAECAESAAADSDEFKGPLAAPVLATLAARIAGGVSAILEQDARHLDGYVPQFLEDDIAFTRDGIRYYGVIDRISKRAADGKLVLVDYKTGGIPPLSSYQTDVPARPGVITDFQMPMYVFLAENSDDSPYKGQKIACAWFAGVKEEKFSTIVDDGEADGPKQKRGTFTREAFEPTMAAFAESAAAFADSVRRMDFTRPEGLSRRECAACDYVRICRWNYAGERQ